MGTGEVKYRPLGADDSARIGELFTEHTGRSPDLDTFRRWIDQYPSAGAVVDGELVGFLVSCRFAPDVLEATNLQVERHHRRAGVGKMLFGDVEAEARRRGFRAMIVAPSELNATQGERVDAPRFYDRLGYETVYETPSTLIVVKTLGPD